MRLRNILTTFDNFVGLEILSPRDVQDYHSMYIDLYNNFRKVSEEEKENINDDLIFEMELIKQVEINIDYIIDCIKKYHLDTNKNKEILLDINRAIESSVELRNKKDLIKQFIESLDMSSSVDDDWIKFVETKKKEELEKIITEESLDPAATYTFIENSFRDGAIVTTGTGIAKILPRISAFTPDQQKSAKKKVVIEKLNEFFSRFFDISSKHL